MPRGRYESAEEIGERIQDLTDEIRDLAAAARQAQKRGEGGRVKTIIANPVLIVNLVSACWSLGAALVPVLSKDKSVTVKTADPDIEVIPKGAKR